MKRFRRLLMLIALALVLAYVAVVALIFLLQRRIIYFPDDFKPMTKMVEQAGLRYWPDSSGDGYVGFITDTPTTESRGLVIVFHGNAATAWGRSYYCDALVPLGFRVLLAEYPGYGGRPGPISEEQFVVDGQRLVRQAFQEMGGPIYLWGESLGAGVAAAVAAALADESEPPPVQGLILLTPWDTLGNLAQSMYPLLPARWLLRDPYDSVANVTQAQVPTAVLIAEDDEIIPPRFGQCLYDTLPQPKYRHVFPKATHNFWPSDPSEPWWRDVMTFVSEHRSESAPSLRRRGGV